LFTEKTGTEELNNLTKPILMCFPCKLSFSVGKSFAHHCETEHALDLLGEEEAALTAATTSAILQCVGPELRPLLSFLQPVAADSAQPAVLVLKPQEESPTDLETGHGHLARPPGYLDENCRPAEDKFTGSMHSSPAAAAAAAAALLDSLRLSFPAGGLRPSAAAALMEASSASGLLSAVMSSAAAAHQATLASAAAATPMNASQLQGTTIGPCPDHVTGRQPGVDCDKCDFILNSCRLGEANWAAQRAVPKAVKCPKCSWTYRYQETLEVHMKEKHPESENSCVYCITGQQHPRLARGETYTCGYKPYRCEVCNYSTTTKGNLSIHMQSDKHINNMQELQNGGVITAPDGTKISQAALAQMPASAVQRLNPSQPLLPSASSVLGGLTAWRCDLCNFEANSPRSLRTHLTGEHHLTVMASMSENIKQLHSVHLLQALMASSLPSSPSKNSELTKPLTSPRHAHPMAELLAEMSYNQALMMQLMKTNGQNWPPHGPPLPPGLLPDPSAAEPTEPPPEPGDPNPRLVFGCAICRDFAASSLERLASHLAVDRSADPGPDFEVAVAIAGVHLCKLCSYKTGLKANFQLHLKTDKHLARLSLLNHIREGGAENEWKMRYLLGLSPVQVRCHACDFFTTSLHKLQAHTASQGHEVRMF
jgi:AT-binding transcription factor 1